MRCAHMATRRVDIAIDGLHEDFDGYRIVQLSDLHIGALTPKSWGMRWVRAASARVSPSPTLADTLEPGRPKSRADG